MKLAFFPTRKLIVKALKYELFLRGHLPIPDSADEITNHILQILTEQAAK